MDGTNERQISPDRFYAVDETKASDPPAASVAPDGNRVIATSADQGTWLFFLDGSLPFQINKAPLTVTWAPDSERIAFVADGKLQTRELTRDAQPEVLIEPTGLLPRAFAWSPIGEQIVYVTDISIDRVPKLEVWLIQSDGFNRRSLGRFNLNQDEVLARDLQWSPNGTALYVGIARPPLLISPNAGLLVPLEDATISGTWTVWAGDSRTLLLRFGPPDQRRLVTLKFDGTDQATLSRQGDYASAAWSPDGQWVVFITFDPTNPDATQLWLAGRDGSQRTRLAADSGFEPAGPVDWSKDGRYVVSSAQGETPAIWRIDTLTGAVVRLVDEGNLVAVAH
jgi:dipeptidyl aminopeptidase/acylaminoacyl peptidase